MFCTDDVTGNNVRWYRRAAPCHHPNRNLNFDLLTSSSLHVHGLPGTIIAQAVFLLEHGQADRQTKHILLSL